MFPCTSGQASEFNVMYSPVVDRASDVLTFHWSDLGVAVSSVFVSMVLYFAQNNTCLTSLSLPKMEGVWQFVVKVRMWRAVKVRICL